MNVETEGVSEALGIEDFVGKYLHLPVPVFLDRFGACITINRAASITGLRHGRLKELATELGFVFAQQNLEPRGFEHLPALPADAVIHPWDGGCTYRVPVHDTPGIKTLIIHNSHSPFEDLQDE